MQRQHTRSPAYIKLIETAHVLSSPHYPGRDITLALQPTSTRQRQHTRSPAYTNQAETEHGHTRSPTYTNQAETAHGHPSSLYQPDREHSPAYINTPLLTVGALAVSPDVSRGSKTEGSRPVTRGGGPRRCSTPMRLRACKLWPPSASDAGCLLLVWALFPRPAPAPLLLAPLLTPWLRTVLQGVR